MLEKRDDMLYAIRVDTSKQSLNSRLTLVAKRFIYRRVINDRRNKPTLSHSIIDRKRTLAITSPEFNCQVQIILRAEM